MADKRSKEQEKAPSPIDDILKAKGGEPFLSHEGSHGILEGDIAPDESPDHFRIYPNPAKKRLYFLVRKEDVQGEVHKWTPDELAQAGFTGQERFRVTLPHDAVVHSVLITPHRIGEQKAGIMSAAADDAATGICGPCRPDLSSPTGCRDDCGRPCDGC